MTNKNYLPPRQTALPCRPLTRRLSQHLLPGKTAFRIANYTDPLSRGRGEKVGLSATNSFTSSLSLVICIFPRAMPSAMQMPTNHRGLPLLNVHFLCNNTSEPAAVLPVLCAFGINLHLDLLLHSTLQMGKKTEDARSLRAERRKCIF